MRPTHAKGEHVPAEPMTAWVRAQLEKIQMSEVKRDDKENGAGVLLAARLGVSETLLYLWRDQKRVSTSDKKRIHADSFPRSTVEDALDRAGVFLWELYPELADEVGPMFDRFCPRCHERVTVGQDSLCPWCESPTLPEVPVKGWCEPEDRLVYPAPDGSCWRCGVKVKQVPWIECGCGCGERMAKFDDYGRKRGYVRGHAPRALERKAQVAVEPFASYLEGQLRTLDLIGAVARAHSIPRDVAVRVLNREDDHVDRETVRRALWSAARLGLGTGIKPRPDALFFSELYPDDVRSKTCPGCGGGKAPHAALCKQCRKAQNKADGIVPQTARTRLSDELLAEAYEVYRRERLTMLTTAERFIDRTPNRNVGSLVHAFSREWKRRGWPKNPR